MNYVIPRDARSGRATDAGVPEFMDFMFKKGFVSCSDAQRREVLDAIAFPKKAAAVMRKLGL